MDIVQKQQNELEAQQSILRLRGIWSNLLKITKVPLLSSCEDDCSTVITWLSLQCAHDASRRPKASHATHHHKETEPLLVHGSLDINQLLETMQRLYNESEEKSSKLTKENCDLRRLLNENGAQRQRLLQEVERGQLTVSGLEMEIEDWRSRARYLETLIVS
jgi:hypothetical protein